MVLRSVEESSEAKVSGWMDSLAIKAASLWAHIKNMDGRKRRGSLNTSWRKGWIMISWVSLTAALSPLQALTRIRFTTGFHLNIGFTILEVISDLFFFFSLCCHPHVFLERPPLWRAQWKRQYPNKIDSTSTDEANVQQREVKTVFNIELFFNDF